MTPPYLLATVWLVAPLVAFGVPLTFFARGTLGPDTLVSAMRELGALFVPYVGVVLAFVYQARRTRRATRPAAGVSKAAAAVAVVTSLVWNLVVILSLMQAAVGALPFETALQTASELAGSLSWAVAPALGYFFGGNSRSETPTRKTA